ncbi:hypothetical protein [Altererythrobacter sp. GH1-8]|uniref:hypothetical protein n=1 Tax=Altererythrobacter sp. GH1-8 TaxID=3349333 RepID=UPI00374DA3DC
MPSFEFATTDNALWDASEPKGGLSPGLFNTHVHVWDQQSLRVYLATGVTTICNASGMPFHLRLVHEIERAKVIGPTLIAKGPILDSPGPNQQINHQMVITSDKAQEAKRGSL